VAAASGGPRGCLVLFSRQDDPRCLPVDVLRDTVLHGLAALACPHAPIAFQVRPHAPRHVPREL
jgi:hypothetical protein